MKKQRDVGVCAKLALFGVVTLGCAGAETSSNTAMNGQAAATTNEAPAPMATTTPSARVMAADPGPPVTASASGARGPCPWDASLTCGSRFPTPIPGESKAKAWESLPEATRKDRESRLLKSALFGEETAPASVPAMASAHAMNRVAASGPGDGPARLGDRPAASPGPLRDALLPGGARPGPGTSLPGAPTDIEPLRKPLRKDWQNRVDDGGSTVVGFEVGQFVGLFDAGLWTPTAPSKTFITQLSEATMAVLKKSQYDAKLEKLDNGQATPKRRYPSCIVRGWRGPAGAPAFTFQITQSIERDGVSDRIDYFPDQEAQQKESSAIIDQVRNEALAFLWRAVESGK